MAEHMWRLRRARFLEAEIWSTGEEPNAAHLVAIQRLTGASERGFYKALKTLRELHKQRGFVPQKPQPQPQTTSALETSPKRTTEPLPIVPTGSTPGLLPLCGPENQPFSTCLVTSA